MFSDTLEPYLFKARIERFTEGVDRNNNPIYHYQINTAAGYVEKANKPKKFKTEEQAVAELHNFAAAHNMKFAQKIRVEITLINGQTISMGG